MNASEGQKTGIIAVILICLGIYGFSVFTIRQPRGLKPFPSGMQRQDSIAVEFHGIEGEGIFFLPPGASPQELFEAAGIKKPVCEDGLLASRIIPGALFTVSDDGRLLGARMSAATRIALGIPLDINRASASDLSLVPGIGDHTAARIIEMRGEKGNFSSLAELTAVPGIKGKRLEKIKAFLTTDSAW